MRCIARASTPMANVEWNAAVLTAVTQHHRLLLVDSYDVLTGDPIPSFCLCAEEEFIRGTLHSACQLVEQGCFSMYVDAPPVLDELHGLL